MLSRAMLRKPDDDEMELTFHLVVGRFIKKQICWEIRKECHRRGYEFAVEEDKGFFRSYLAFTIDGIPESEFDEFRDLLKGWLDSIAED